MESEISNLQKFIDKLIEFGTQYGLQVIGALLVLAIGVIAGNWAAGVTLKLCEKKKLDITLSKFIANCAKITVLTFAVIIALGKFGITIAPFIAAISAMAFGASFAIQGPLSNYGAGLSIILARPFVVGDTITVTGQSGVVEEVKLACTILRDEDGVKITIPNKHIVGEVVHNSQKNKIVESMVGISYDSNPEKAIRIIEKTIRSFAEVCTDPVPHIGIQEFADSSINIGMRYWIPTVKYHPSLFAINLAVFNAFKDAGVSIPFPQRDVHIIDKPVAGK